MAEFLSDAQIALLCTIEEHDVSRVTGDKRRDLERLISDGYVEPTQVAAGAPLRLTAKGLAFIGERGAGLNEA